MTIPSMPNPNTKKFESTTAKLLVAFAKAQENLKEVKKEFAVAQAIAGSIRSKTKYSIPDLAERDHHVMELMARLTSPPETSTKVTPLMRESLQNIYSQNKTMADALKDDYMKIEKKRDEIFIAVSRSPITPDEIRKLEQDLGKYFIEVDALIKKMEPFINKVEGQASNIVPGIQVARPSEQRTLKN